jgi:hypothetical protein
MNRILITSAIAAAAFAATPTVSRAQDTAIVVRPAGASPVAPGERPPRPLESVVGTGPNGAKMRCKDGSYPAVNAPDTACDTKGGILVRFPLRRTPANGPALRAAGPVPPPKDSVTAPALMLEPVPDRSRVIVPAERPPANATMQCSDGTYVVRDTSSVRCAGKGGVAIRFLTRNP